MKIKKIFFATNYKIDKEDLKNTYNVKNRGVDVFDQYLGNSSIQRKTKKWYKKVFLFGIDAAIINSKIICELKEKRTYSTVLFKEKIIETIFEIYKKYNSNNNNFIPTNNKSYIPNRFRLILHNIGHIINEKKDVNISLKKHLIFVKNVICIYIQNVLPFIIIIMFIIKQIINFYFKIKIKV